MHNMLGYVLLYYLVCNIDYVLCEDACAALSIQNGIVEVTLGYTLGSVATFTCNNGYYIIGPASKTCKLNKNGRPIWLPGRIPVCWEEGIIEHCPLLPPLPDHLSITTESYHENGIYKPKDHVWFSCDDGYFLSGTTYMKCKSSLRWKNSVPTCTEITCPDISPLPDRLFITEGVSINNSWGNQVSFKCAAGYYINGHATITCIDGTDPTMAVGRWSDPLPTCEAINCSILGDCNGHGTCIGPNVCQCQSGWQGDDCSQAESCDVLPYIQNGYITYSYWVLGVGITATYACYSPYHLNDPSLSMRECTNNGNNLIWDGKAPECVALKACSTLPFIPNGNIKYSDDRKVPGSEAHYTCRPPYVISDPSKTMRRCTEELVWDGTTPECKISVSNTCCCPKLPSCLHGYVNVTGYEVGDTAKYGCYQGFIPDGVRECMPGLQWSGSHTCCKQDISCDVTLKEYYFPDLTNCTQYYHCSVEGVAELKV
ncbi:unnamed protein product, partial [Owenia fusiformis]